MKHELELLLWAISVIGLALCTMVTIMNLILWYLKGKAADKKVHIASLILSLPIMAITSAYLYYNF